MNNERDDRNSKTGEQPKRKYRLNKRKFAVAISVLCFTVAAIMIADHYISSVGEKEVVAAINPPQQTPGAQNSEKPSGGGTGSGGISGKLILVDAGHGGFDPGAEGVSGTREDELNLKVAFILKEELESLGAQVIMTRSDENAIAETKELDMAKRREIIEQCGSDIVVSVHMNSFGDSNVSGPLVMYMAGSENGKNLAETIISSMNEMLEPDSEGKTRSENDKFILKSGNQPCVIVECGYISNSKEEEKLVSEQYQRNVAKAICSGLEVYFGS
jgi:N-acetylmuramoyl-L-alanine amidase